MGAGMTVGCRRVRRGCGAERLTEVLTEDSGRVQGAGMTSRNPGGRALRVRIAAGILK